MYNIVSCRVFRDIITTTLLATNKLTKNSEELSQLVNSSLHCPVKKQNTSTKLQWLTSSLRSLMLSLGVLLIWRADIWLAGENMVDTALFILLGVLLKENARPTFCLVLWKDEKARLNVDTLRSLASRDMSRAARRTKSWSGSGRHRVLATLRQIVRRNVT